MRRSLLLLFVSIFACGVSLAAVPGDDTTPEYRPPVADASKEGEQALGSFRVPENMQAELVAAEPLLANPVAFCIDDAGRFYVAETYRQQKGVEDNRFHMDWLLDDLAAQTVADRVAYFKKHLGDKVNDYAVEHDRIRLLEDTDGDGKIDRSTLFADGFNKIEDGTGAGVLAIDGNVYYTCIPKLYLLRDENGDGKSDTREVLHDGYGVRVAFRGHDMHGLTQGPDGRLYFSIGDRGYNVLTQEGIRLKRPDTGAVFRCELDGSHLEEFAYGLRNPQELAFDDYGNLFTGDNNSDSGDQARWVYVVQGGDTGWRMYYQYLSDRGPWNRERMWYPYRADAETTEKQPAYIVPPIANLGDGPSGLTYYPGVGLPDRYQNHFFMADFRGTSSNSGIRSFTNQPQGATFRLDDSHEFLWSILATDVDFGLDGSVYVSDWVSGWEGPGKGRIYRFHDPAYLKAGERGAALIRAGFQTLATDRLAQLFDNPDRRVRLKAQFELVKRIQNGKATSASLIDMLDPKHSRLTRVHAIWSAGQLLRTDELTAEQTARLAEMLHDKDLEIRAQTARVLGDSFANPLLDGLREVLRHDDSARVQHLAAISFGRIYPHAETNPAQAALDVRLLLDLFATNKDADPVLRHSAVMGLVGIGQRYPQLLTSAEARSEPERLGILLALRRLEDPAIRMFLDDPSPNLILEAARAINDEPLDALTPELASLAAESALHDLDPLIRRVIHANFRLGGESHAAAVSQLAASDKVSQAVRMEAANALLDWRKPGPLDRVIGSWRPLDEAQKSRGTVEELAVQIRPALGGILSGDTELRKLGIQVAAAYGIKDVGPTLWEIFRDQKNADEVRGEALSALASLKNEEIRAGIETALKADNATLRIAGRGALLKTSPEEAIPILAEAVESGTTPEQQHAIQELSQLDNRNVDALLGSLMQRLLAGDLDPAIGLDVLLAAKERIRQPISQLVTQFEQQLSQQENALDKYSLTLQGGSAERGAEIFFGRSEASCRRCHKIDESGGEVGPDLSKIAIDKDRRYLLESLVLPNAKIAKGFETAVLIMDSGKVITGIIKAETADSLSIMRADGSVVGVNKDEIDERAPGKSGMPEDLIKQLTLSDLRDLVEYLSQRKGTAAKNNGPGYAE